jgi:hypothetical protein
MYLDMRGEWYLPSLAGVTTSPLLSADGTFRVVDGYDRITRLLCSDIPRLNIVEKPTKADAEDALVRLRQAFRTFPFADSPRCWDHALSLEVIDLTVRTARPAACPTWTIFYELGFELQPAGFTSLGFRNLEAG